MEVSILTGGGDRPYVFGLMTSLVASGVRVDLIAGDELDSPEFRDSSAVNFLNLRGDQRRGAGLVARTSRVLAYYARLLRYAASAKPRLFHVLWNNRFEAIDRTLVMLYYKLMGKKIIFTAHNINTRKRDGTDTLFNRLTLKAQYRLADHVFVHTDKMREELIADFAVPASAVSTIPFGINNSVPDTALTPAEARRRLGLAPHEKVMLFFGRIAPYKGLEYLVDAFRRLQDRHPDYRLIIAGRPKLLGEEYWTDLQARINLELGADRVVQRIEFIPDAETEVYFKAADVLVLPYADVFQSGVLFLGYSFGLPVIVADVGSLKDGVVEGETGYVFPPRDPAALAAAVETYFASELYRNLPTQRAAIKARANRLHSWETVSHMTRQVYQQLLANQS